MNTVDNEELKEQVRLFIKKGIQGIRCSTGSHGGYRPGNQGFTSFYGG